MLVIDSTKIAIEKLPAVTGLPRGAFVEYFGAVESGAEFVIFRPDKDWDYKCWQCVMRARGMPKFIPVEIISVSRLRDGGTTTIQIEAGKFHFPTPFKPDAEPTYNGTPLTLYERSTQTRQLM